MKKIFKMIDWLWVIFSVLFFTIALFYCWYGLYGFSHFVFYTGSDDENAHLFLRTIAPAGWGVIFLTLGFVLRLRYRRLSLVFASVPFLIVSAWKLLTVPPPVEGYNLFPDVETLWFLIFLAVVFLFLAFIDKYIQRGINHICRYLVTALRKMSARRM